jgi:alkanesulfonate monooxygenase SsuD/methylene tetrahydromethanopterin reductase-like flavin-dependent oxidoreductase (luciferase family)
MRSGRREMHFGVFVLGTGNHSAGWRYEGAATSNNDLAVIQEIAHHAERGKFDLLFVSDGLVMARATTRPSCAASSRPRSSRR